MVSVARARVEPGVTPRWHHRPNLTERSLILEEWRRVEGGDGSPEAVGLSDGVPVPPGVRPPIANTGDADLIFLATGTLRFAGTGDEDVAPMGRASAASAGAVRQFQADDAGDDQAHGDQPPSAGGIPIKQDADREGSRRADAGPDRIGGPDGNVARGRRKPACFRLEPRPPTAAANRPATGPVR